MNLSKLPITHPLPAILLFILLTICGLISFKRMAVQYAPDIDIPVVLISANLPGASPSQLETEVARKLESALAAIPLVKHVNSTISDGVVVTSAEFRVGKKPLDAMIEVRDAITSIRSDLPSAMLDPVITKAGDVSTDPVLTYSISSDKMDQQTLSWFVDNNVSKAILPLTGVGRVIRVGGVSREVLIELDPVKLAALNIAPTTIASQIQLIQQESSSGKATVGGNNQSIRTLGNVKSAEEIAALQISLPGGRRIALDQIASVQDTHGEVKSIALQDGKPAVGFHISRTVGGSELTLAKGVRKTIAELQTKYPEVKFQEAYNRVDQVKDNYSGSMSLLYEGAILTVLVVWLFLRDWRATLIAAIALPLSVIPTFLALHLMDFTLNLVTLISLALVIGILVDDAIVEIENIMHHLRMGKSPLQAAIDAVNEISLAVVATTFALVAVFLPTAFLSDIVGQYFKQFGWTASIAILVSLAVARLLTPVMAAYLLRPIAIKDEEGPLLHRYLALVNWCMEHRAMTLFASALFFVGSLLLIPSIPSEFIPASDDGISTVTIDLPPGSALQDTRASAESARMILMQDKDVKEVFSLIGEDGSRRAVLTATLKPHPERSRKQQEVDKGLLQSLLALPGVRVTIGGESSDKLVVALAGDNPATLESAANALQNEIRKIEGLGTIHSNISLVRPELIVTPDSARSADLGVTPAQIGETLRIATFGDYEQYLPKMNLADRQIPVRVRLPESARQDLDLLGRLSVAGQRGNVPLSSVADLRLDSAPAQIERRDRTRIVKIHIVLNGQADDDVMDKIKETAVWKNLPDDVKPIKLGDVERQQDLALSFLSAIFIGILCVYMVLVLLFNGFMQPLTVMTALPLSIGGAFLGLLLSGKSLSMPSLLGILMLMGIAAKNSILLVEYALRVQREHGLSRHDALIEACRNRARPIIMTTIAMSAGMLPIALGFGADPSFRSPMAIAVIGGLMTSTFLSLLVIPVMFVVMDNMVQKRATKRAARSARHLEKLQRAQEAKNQASTRI